MNEKISKKIVILDEKKNKNNGCIKSLFSCCIKTLKLNKSQYINKWKNYITNYLKSKDILNDPFAILTKLWAHENIISDLSKVRINPKLEYSLYNNKEEDEVLEVSIRDDLEFYIPQLCLFILFGEFELVEELLSFLCKACYFSYNFAHRVLWFLKSMLNQEQIDKTSNDKIKRIIYVIQTIYTSDSKDNKNICVNYYVNGSEKYINYIKNNKCDAELQIFNLNIFKKYSSCSNATEYINSNDKGKLKLMDENDINLVSFSSTINFIDSLCDICERLKLIEDTEKRNEEFNNELLYINKSLPLNVYIPFSNKNIRNYIITNISIPDCKIIKTKERTPFILTCECVRLDELCYIIDTNNYIERAKSFEFEEVTEPHITEIIKKLNKKGNEAEKLKYLLSEDYKNSMPIYVEKKRNNHYESIKESNKLVIHPEALIKQKEYEKIDQALRDNVTNDNCIFTEESVLDDLNDSKIEDNNTNNTNKSIRKVSISSNDSSDSKSDDEKTVNENIIVTKKEYEIVNKENKNQETALFNIFGETSDKLKYKLKKESKFGHLLTYRPIQFIVKSGEDLRQEQFASQLINTFAQIFKMEKVDCYLYPYEIISTGNNSGIIELVENSMSLDCLKQKMNALYPNYTLKDFYDNYFVVNSHQHKKAIKNLIQSLAGYSLVCYFLQIKDRHNGNILIDNQGHLIHIDFGFIFSNSPGHEFETAPFKLTNEIIDIFGGVNSSNFQKFRKLMWKGMIAISKHYQKILILVEMMYCGLGKKMDCFKDGEKTLIDLKQRFSPKENMKKKDYIALVDSLIEKALGSWRTKWYDKYQYYFQGIFY